MNLPPYGQSMCAAKAAIQRTADLCSRLTGNALAIAARTTQGNDYQPPVIAINWARAAATVAPFATYEEIFSTIDLASSGGLFAR